MLLLPGLTVKIWFFQISEVFFKSCQMHLSPWCEENMLEPLGQWETYLCLEHKGWNLCRCSEILPNWEKNVGFYFVLLKETLLSETYFKDFGRTLGRNDWQQALATAEDNSKRNLESHCKARIVSTRSPPWWRGQSFFFFGQDFFRGLNQVIPWSDTHSSV